MQNVTPASQPPLDAVSPATAPANLKKSPGWRQSLVALAVFGVWGAVVVANFYAPKSAARQAYEDREVELSRSDEVGRLSRRLEGCVVELTVAGDATADATADGGPDGSESPADGADVPVSGAPSARRTIGCGVLVDGKGLVLTSRRLAARGAGLQVRTADGRTFDAQRVDGRDSELLGLVRIDADGALPTVRLSSGERPTVGDWVVTLRRRDDGPVAVHFGVVRETASTTSPDELALDDSARADAEGAPTFNRFGELIGMAVPSDSKARSALRVVAVGAADEWLVRAIGPQPASAPRQLGFTVRPVPPEIARRDNLAPGAGALVVSVEPDTPGAQAGLQAGDVVVALGDQQVATAADLDRAARRSGAGRRSPVEIVRAGWRMTLQLKLPADDAP